MESVSGLPEAVVPILVELVEKTAFLRRDLKQKGDAEKYAARVARIEQKLKALADLVEGTDPALARALRTAWDRPAMSLAYRNADHRKR
jgi:hypothetical protein